MQRKEVFQVRPAEAVFSDLRWVLLARHKSALNYSLHTVHRTEKFLECTDGHRLHRLMISDTEEFPLPPGCYNVLFCNKKDGLMLEMMPDASFVQSEVADSWIEGAVKAKANIKTGSSAVATMLVAQAMPGGAVDPEYVKDVIQGFPNGCVARVYGNERPVFFTSEDKDRLAFIMPIHMEGMGSVTFYKE